MSSDDEIEGPVPTDGLELVGALGADATQRGPQAVLRVDDLGRVLTTAAGMTGLGTDGGEPTVFERCLDLALGGIDAADGPCRCRPAALMPLPDSGR